MKRVTLAAVLFALGCATGCATDIAGDDLTEDAGQDTGSTLDTGNNNLDMGQPEDTSPPADVGQPEDMGPDVAWEYCVLETEDPWGDCVTTDQVDFGMTSQNAVLNLTTRFTNLSENNIIVRRTETLNMQVSITPGLYDMQTPPAFTEAPLAHQLSPGSTLFLVVQIEVGTTTGVLGGSIDMWITRGSDEEENVPVGYRVEVQDCPMDTADCDGNSANGCETNVLVNSDHCGMCGNMCDLANASSTCNAGDCVIVTCDGGFDNCDTFDSTGCESNTDVDVDNCGACGMPCAYDNAMTTCGGGMCMFDACDPDFHDIDMDLDSNGCEYNCTFVSANDAPDDLFGDENCDGIDGDVNKAVFVAADGNDAFAGTMAMPVRTIAEAISIVQATSGLEEIYVSSGDYPETVQLANGISIYGGYERANGWQRSAAIKPRIIQSTPTSNRIIAVRGLDINQLTVIDRMRIEASPAASMAGVSNYGVHCRNCSGLLIQNSNIVVGDAADGSPGSSGTDGITAFGRGFQGDMGNPGSCDGSHGTGGAGGASDCGRTGGAGGRGALEGSNNGLRGGDGAGFTTNGPGYGGPGGGEESNGGPGNAGSNGSSGNDGAGGTGGSVVGFYWSGDDGNNGGPGGHAGGGGGGGGGGGQNGTFVNDGGGNGGGGGGGGGCGGLGATGGTTGGSAFGIFLVTSTGFSIDQSTITVGDGGNGGTGGGGGSGSSGGAGRAGAQVCLSEIGGGGSGAAGGNGGRGGHGGGGSGGNSYGIYRDGTTVSIPAGTTVTVGTAGNGGTSPGPASSDGDDGVAAQTN